MLSKFNPRNIRPLLSFVVLTLSLCGATILLSGSAQAAPISVDNPDILWSPYGWVANGSTYKQSPTTGSYINIAFSGDTLALNVDTSFVTNPANFRVSAFIDGGTTPIHRTLADASANRITFSDSLSPGNHYATIVIMRNNNASARWTVTGDTPPSTLRITSIEISDSGSILPLSGTPLTEKNTTILFYGDSITEGNGINNVDSYFATGATVGRLLGANYGIKGYSSSLWYFNILSGVPDFWNIPGPNYTNVVWKNYYQNQPLLNDVNVPSSGFIEGAPDAIYNNLGNNDAALYPNPTWGGETARLTFRDRIIGWLPEAREALGGRPAIFMVMPYTFNCTEDINPDRDEALMALYRDTYIEAYDSYIQSSGDTRAYLIDLGSEGCRIQYEDGDGVHPSESGAYDIAQLIAAQTQQHIILEEDVVITAHADNQALSNNMTLSNPPTFSGTAPAGSAITLSLTQHSNTTTCEAEADEQGEWTCAFLQTLAVGDYTLSITGETSWGEAISLGVFDIQLASVDQSNPTDQDQNQQDQDQSEADDTLADSGTGIAPILGSVLIVTIIAWASRRVRPVFQQLR